MSYGAPVQARMVVDTQPRVSQYRPELADVPKVDPTSVNSVRLQGTLTKRMPPVPDANPFSKAKAEEAEELAFGMRKAFSITRSQNEKSAKISKAKNARTGKIVERASGFPGSSARNLGKRKEARSRAIARRNASDVNAYHLMRPFTQSTVFGG